MSNNINKAQSGLIYIDSRRRDYGSSSAFTLSWNEDIIMDGIGLLSVIMPNTFYNINDFNNTISITEGSNTVSIVLSNGVYNIASLLSTLATALTNNLTLTGTFTCTLDTITQKVVISSTVAFIINMDTLGYGLATSLGFTSTQSSATTQTANNLYDISGTREVYIQVNLPLASHFNDDLRDIIGGVPVVQGSFGDIITKSYESSEQMIWFSSTQYINSLSISLVDGYGRPMDLNGVNWSMELAYTRSSGN